MVRVVLSAVALTVEKRQAGVNRAVVWRTEQVQTSPVLGHRLLSDDLDRHEQLYGLWAVTPAACDESPGPEQLLTEMRKKRIIGFRLFPTGLRFVPKAFVLQAWLELAVQHHLPVFVNTAHGCSLEALGDILERFPDLTVVLTNANVWPGDRLLRPFVERFPNVYLDLSYMITAGGIESFVARFGATRLLYGSGFPRMYFGANMLMLRHAAISQEDRAAIAAGNLERIIREIRYD